MNGWQAPKQKSRPFKSAAKRLRRLDVFGAPINLTFKGNETYKTVFGAIVTISMIIAFVLMAVIKTRKLVLHENSERVMQTSRLDLETTEAIDFMDYEFMFAIVQPDEKLINLEVLQNY